MNHEHPIIAADAPADAPATQGSPATRIVLLLLLVAGIGGGWWLVRSRAKAATASAAAASSAIANRVVPVLTTEVVRRDVPIWREGLGSVAAFYTVTVKTQVDGRIDRVAFTEGQHVKKGDLLVQIDPRPFAIQLESAQAALARDGSALKNGKLNLDRYKTLSQQNLIAVQQYTDQIATVDQADAQMHTDQALIDTARLNLDYARITSPIDGVTGVRLVDPGNVVHATDTTGLVVVTQLDPIAVFFTLPEDDLPDISAATASGPQVSALRGAQPDMPHAGLEVEALSRDGDRPLGTGRLSVVDNQINQQTATIRLKAIFPNPGASLWPNQFVKARVKLSTRAGALVVPAAVVQHGPSGTFAYVVGADSTAEMRPVTIDSVQGDTAVVKSGLNAGDQAVVDGQAQLRPGSRVSARPVGGTHPGASASASAPASPRPAAAGPGP